MEGFLHIGDVRRQCCIVVLASWRRDALVDPVAPAEGEVGAPIRVDGQSGDIADDDEKLLGPGEGDVGPARLEEDAAICTLVSLDALCGGADGREEDDAAGAVVCYFRCSEDGSALRTSPCLAAIRRCRRRRPTDRSHAARAGSAKLARERV